jgi:hypothetical protein
MAGAKRFPLLRRNPTEARPDPALWGSFRGLLFRSWQGGLPDDPGVLRVPGG